MMKKIFDMDNPVMRALSAAADLILLNLLTLLCSLPLVTLGAAMSAMYDVVIRMLRGEEGYVARSFFRALRANIKQGVVLSLVLLAAAALLYIDYLAASAYAPALRVVIASMGVLTLGIAMYVFALQARYENRVPVTLKNAVFLMAAYFPRTLGMLAFTAALWLLSLRFPQIGGPVLLLFGFSAPCYISVMLLRGVFRKLEGDAGGDTPDGEDEDENE